MDVFCTVIDIISVWGSIPIEIPILWPRAVMVGPRPRVLLTLPLMNSAYLPNPFVPKAREIWYLTYDLRGTAVAQWLRCCATIRKVAGSIPAGVNGIFH